MLAISTYNYFCLSSDLYDAIMTGGCIQKSFQNKSVLRGRELQRGLINLTKTSETTFQ